jgi:hypothetical protein
VDPISAYISSGNTAFSLVYFLSKTQMNALLSPNQKSLIQELEHWGSSGKTFFYMIYRIYFSHNYHTEKSTVQVHIPPPLCIILTINENMKQTYE